jgi:hypothetical protein
MIKQSLSSIELPLEPARVLLYIGHRHRRGNHKKVHNHMKLSCGTNQSAFSVFTGVSLFVRRTAGRRKRRRKSGAGDAANGWHCMTKVSKMISSNRARWSLIVALITAVTVPPSTAQVPANVRDVGATSLMILYRCLPDKRPALRSYMEQHEIPRLRKMITSGAIANEKVLFSRYVDTDNWDMLVLLDFPSPAKAAQWQAQERENPAGLDQYALKLISAIATYPLDLMQSAAATTSTEKPVYLILPYDYTVSPDEYIAYLRDYVRPQAAGWIEEGVLESYKMFIGRDAGGRPWSSILLLEYKNDEALGQRAAVIARVRAKLRADPSWKAISDRKQSVRVERAAILADELK